MDDPHLQDLCEQGQQALMDMHYLMAEQSLSEAENIAWQAGDFDTLSRLYMPLQEARRQRRQRCGEGTIAVDLLAWSPEESQDPGQIVELFPHGQLLVAGWQSIEPSLEIRKLQAERGLYLDVFLAAVYPVGEERFVVIVPTPMPMPNAMDFHSLLDLQSDLPPHSLILGEADLPGPSYGDVMRIWERLHTPWLAEAEQIADPIQRMEAYRQTIEVDYACELAHQYLSDTAKLLGRTSS